MSAKSLPGGEKWRGRGEGAGVVGVAGNGQDRDGKGLLRKNEAVLLGEELDLNCMANAAWAVDWCYVRHGSGRVASRSHWVRKTTSVFSTRTLSQVR